MDDDFGVGFWFGIIIGVLMVLIMAAVVDIYNDTHYRKILVDNGCGQYNSKTSKFELINMRVE